MNTGADPALVREVLRDVLADLLPELVAEAVGASAGGAIPAMPPPPVAAVHRPSGWHGAAPAASMGTGVEAVSLTSDAELQAFVQRLLALFESPRDRLAVSSGALRFTLRAGTSAAAGGAAGVQRIDKGAVTERAVRAAAETGSSIELGPRAVLTPLARDIARTLGVKIEKEKRC
jgi:hypothetical protein